MELKLQNVKKSFHHTPVVQGISVSLHEGIHALLGANGCGKTTLIRMLVGTLSPTEGHVYIDNVDILDQYEYYCSLLGYLPQDFGFYPHYTIDEFLLYIGQLKKLRESECKKRIDILLEQLNLTQVQKKKMKHLSGGMLRRVGIAQALLKKPKILILDEPTAGLDPKERIVFHNLLASLADQCIILLSTHIVSDIESTADDILVMKDGQILQHDHQEALLASMKHKVWEVQMDRSMARELLETCIVVHTQQMEQQQILLRIVQDTSPLPQAQLVQATLDDYYLYHFAKGGESHDILNSF